MFSLLGVIKFKNDDDEYIFKSSEFLAAAANQTVMLYLNRNTHIDSRLALIAFTIEQWFKESNNTDDNFKIPFKEVCEYV